MTAPDMGVPRSTVIQHLHSALVSAPRVAACKHTSAHRNAARIIAEARRVGGTIHGTSEEIFVRLGLEGSPVAAIAKAREHLDHQGCSYRRNGRIHPRKSAGGGLASPLIVDLYDPLPGGIARAAEAERLRIEAANEDKIADFHKGIADPAPAPSPAPAPDPDPTPSPTNDDLLKAVLRAQACAADLRVAEANLRAAQAWRDAATAEVTAIAARMAAK
jgi:hypothetical protein